jgi:hypothetical protein
MAKLPEVEAWRRDELNERQRFEWASPRAIISHCPYLADPNKQKTRKTAPVRRPAGFAVVETKRHPNAPYSRTTACVCARQCTEGATPAAPNNRENAHLSTEPPPRPPQSV